MGQIKLNKLAVLTGPVYSQTLKSRVQFCLLSKIENEEIICQIFGIGKCSYQRGDRVSKYGKNCHFCRMRQ